MFGSEYKWNMEGHDTYKTLPGACCSLLLLIAVVIYATYVVRLAVDGLTHPIINTHEYKDFYDSSEWVKQETDNFYFAFGLSSLSSFDEQDQQAFKDNDLKFAMDYEIIGGPEDGKVFEYTIKRCEEAELARFHPLDKVGEKTIQAHIDANQFFCPDHFDLSFYGKRDASEHKMINLKLQQKQTTLS